MSAPYSLPPHLLTTKLNLPPARAQVVARPRLLERLDAGLQGKLTLVAAPAGFGKTTLLSAWRASPAAAGVRFGSVSLDAGDNDPLLFWSYFLAALDLAAPGAGGPALASLQAAQPPPIEITLTGVLNAFAADAAELPDRHLVLALEDYHTITTPAIHAALAWLLDRLPATLHLALLTRADPPLPLARMRARGDLTELHAGDLRFTPNEVATFLNQTMGLALAPADLAALEARTEGWVAGLHLAALALQSHPDRAGFLHTFSGTHRYIVDYLAAEVLEHQPAHVQTFLLRTAILDRLCDALGEAVLAPAEPGARAASGSTGQSQLEALERANLFVVPLDHDRQWYRYHHLFADVLRQRLTRSATTAEIAALHERASVWYEANGLVAEAVQHALAIPDGRRAAQLIERHGLKTIVGGQTQTALAWLARLPETLRRTRPYLGILHALALLFTSDLEGAEARLQDTEACIGPGTAATDATDARFIQGNIAAIRANIATYTGDLAACAAYGERVLALLPESEVIARTTACLHVARRYRVTGMVTAAVEREALAAVGPIRASGNRMAALAAVINVARLRALQGGLHAAAETYQELVAIAGGPEALQSMHGALPYFVALGQLHFEWNALERAGELLAHALAWAPGTATTDGEFVLLGYLAQARLQQARGETAPAHGTLLAAAELARRRGFAAHLVTRVAAAQAHLALLAGNLPAATAWAAASGLGAEDELLFSREPEYLMLARVWTIQTAPGHSGDRLDQALRLLERLLADAVAGERGASVIEILILQALALAAQRDRAGALAVLGRALEQAAPEGYIRSFVDEGPALWALLRAVDPGSVVGGPSYVPRLLEAIAAERGGRTPVSSAQAAPPASNAGLVEPLTAREVEVLRLIAAGQSNAQVADALVIAVSTVKTHTNTIFGKLGVTSRTQAIARAHALRLL